MSRYAIAPDGTPPPIMHGTLDYAATTAMRLYPTLHNDYIVYRYEDYQPPTPIGTVAEFLRRLTIEYTPEIYGGNLIHHSPRWVLRE